MAEEWNQERIQREYIDAQAEESTTLEYKAAGALEKSPGKKKEITKDVSAMANADGGIIIYGVKEYEGDKKHLPEKLDPIDRTQFSKEWLEQVINNIRPRIDGLTIHPVPVNIIDAEPNNVIYVVEIPKSTTAHQATDLKYYRRYNFQCLPMQDYEIRDVMNRATTPDAQVEFSGKLLHYDSKEHFYELEVIVKNLGFLVINHFKLEFTFPDLDSISLRLPMESAAPETGDKWVDLVVKDNVAVSFGREEYIIRVTYRSRNVLFPKDEEDIGEAIVLRYRINRYIGHRKDMPPLNWTLYADNMLPKQGEIPFPELHKY